MILQGTNIDYREAQIKSAQKRRKASKYAGVSKHNRGTLWRASINTRGGKWRQLCSAPLTPEGELRGAKAYWDEYNRITGQEPPAPNPYK